MVSGLPAAARAYLIADLLAVSNKRIALICPDSPAAARMHDEIRAFLRLSGHDELAGRVGLFPGWEHSPYRAFQPSIRDRIRRQRALHDVSTGAARALVTDVASLAQCCPRRNGFEQRGFRVGVGDILPRETLLDRLALAGYTRADPAEDPGTFALRGSIVDVFSPAGRRPLRLDFFDELLETIRTYDSVTQRGDGASLERADIIPVTPFMVTAETLVAAKSGIKAFCDEHGIPKRSRDELFESLDAGVREPRLEYLLPYFEPSGVEASAWLPDYLKQEEGWVLALSDRLASEAAHDELVTDLKDGFRQSVAQGQIVAPWERLYASPERFGALLRTGISLRLDELRLGVPGPSAAEPDGSEEAAPDEDTDTIDVRVARNGGLTLPAHLADLAALSKTWSERGFAAAVVATTASQAERLGFILRQHGIPCRLVDRVDWEDATAIQIAEGRLASGFRLARDKVAVVTDSELFGPKKPRQAASGKRATPEIPAFVPSLEELNANELVVHANHGIGRYRGLCKLEIDRVPQDFLLIEYAGADKLYLPVYRLDQVQRYVGSQQGVALDRLGTAGFEKTKAKVKAALQDLAHKLLELYAKRASRQGFEFSPPDEAYREFEARFPYAETPDQLASIERVEKDMQSPKIMDRLICGDVGYGKTEVALRAAFRAVADEKQVAVLVPTTVLALQHDRSFRERFKDAPVTIGTLSRFKTPRETRELLAGLREGTVDVVIGTHRLLSKDVAFKDLGLLVIDEEQRFGVEHKERLKLLKTTTDVLTLTATPIPRTLHMALMGLRDISVINTPPADRLSVRTYVARFDEDVIRRAIRQELARGGQVFFIHNRVQSIHAMADRLKEIVPEARLIVAHGQLEDRQLEEKMLAFYGREADVLLCSAIIESGLDIPTANTMIIHRADTFGLAQLYQLRGRVGRSQARAYCYLLLPEEGAVTDDARARLEVIQRFVDLGSGFKIASHDLELRGGGDVLGKSQSGHIAAVGFELYTDLLDEAIREIKGQPLEDRFDPEIKIPVPALLPEDFVPDIHQRLGLYKRLSMATDADALHALELELQDRYGKAPVEAQNLFWLIRIKQLLRRYHIRTLIVGKERTALDASSEARLSPEKTLALMKRQPGDVALTPDSKILLRRPFKSVAQLFQDVQKLLEQVAEQQGAC